MPKANESDDIAYLLSTITLENKNIKGKNYTCQTERSKIR